MWCTLVSGTLGPLELLQAATMHQNEFRLRFQKKSLMQRLNLSHIGETCCAMAIKCLRHHGASKCLGSPPRLKAKHLKLREVANAMLAPSSVCAMAAPSTVRVLHASASVFLRVQHAHIATQIRSTRNLKRTVQWFFFFFDTRMSRRLSIRSLGSTDCARHNGVSK